MSHNFALLRVDKACTENERLNLAVLDSDVGICSGRRNNRNVVVRRNLTFGDNVGCNGRTYKRNNFIVGNEFGSGVDCLSRFGFGVRLDNFNFLAVNAARVVNFLNRKF